MTRGDSLGDAPRESFARVTGRAGERAGAVRGLSDADRLRTAGEYFAEFAWEPRALDPRTMSAAEFLAGL